MSIDREQCEDDVRGQIGQVDEDIGDEVSGDGHMKVCESNGRRDDDICIVFLGMDLLKENYL